MKYIVIILSFILLVSLCACNTGETIKEPSVRTSIESFEPLTETTPTDSEDEGNEAEHKPLDKLDFSYLQVNGETVSYPTPWTELAPYFDTVYRWDSTDKELKEKTLQDTISQDALRSFDFIWVGDSGNYCEWDVMVNFEDTPSMANPLPLSDATVYSITLTGCDENGAPLGLVNDCPMVDVSLPGGVTLGTTRADVEALYGAPDETVGFSTNGLAKYISDDGLYEVEMTFNANGLLTELHIDLAR